MLLHVWVFWFLFLLCFVCSYFAILIIWKESHILLTSQVLFLIVSKLWSVYRLEITILVGWALNTNNYLTVENEVIKVAASGLCQPVAVYLRWEVAVRSQSTESTKQTRSDLCWNALSSLGGAWVRQRTRGSDLPSNIIPQDLCEAWTTGQVQEFEIKISRPSKVTEFTVCSQSHGKSWNSEINLYTTSLLWKWSWLFCRLQKTIASSLKGLGTIDSELSYSIITEGGGEGQ